jgi:hypothetical protein
MSTFTDKSHNIISTTFFEAPKSYYPWVVPNPGDYLHYSNEMPLSPIKSSYQAIQSTTLTLPSLYDSSPNTFHMLFPTDEMIMSVMSMKDTPWDNGNYHSILFLECDTIKSYQQILTPSTVLQFPSQHTMFCTKGT